MTTPRHTMPTAMLPTEVRAALKFLRYGAPQIEVVGSEICTISTCGGDGMRGFAVILDFEARTSESHYGSWGGPNPFTRGSNPVDDIHAPPTTVPSHGAIIVGSEGRRVFASVYVAPATFASLVGTEADRVVAGDAAAEQRGDVLSALAATVATVANGGDDLTELDRRVMYAFGALKSGPYRKEHLARIACGDSLRKTAPLGADVVQSAVDSLVSRGYLKRAANGATGITTKGQNARRQRGGGEVW